VPPPTRVALSRAGLTRGAIGVRAPRSWGTCADPAVIGGGVGAGARFGATALGCLLTSTGLDCGFSAGQGLVTAAPASPPRPPYTFLPRPSTRRLQARSIRTPWAAPPPCRAPDSGPRSSALTAVCASAAGHAATTQATKPTATSWPAALREKYLIEGRSLRQTASSPGFLVKRVDQLASWTDTYRGIRGQWTDAPARVVPLALRDRRRRLSIRVCRQEPWTLGRAYTLHLVIILSRRSGPRKRNPGIQVESGRARLDSGC
jgi:hypothetical protein